MTVSVILAHPREGSFNHAIAETVVRALVRAGHRANFHDLYKEAFDPVLRSEEIPRDSMTDSIVRRHCDEIALADGIVVIHPNWWGQPPAILKGWIDRVFRPGVAYEFNEGDSGEGVPRGLLRARLAVVFNTSNTYTDRELDVFGDPLETIWKNCILGLCGIDEFYRKTFSVVVTSTEDQRRQWLNEVEKIIEDRFPLGRM